MLPLAVSVISMKPASAGELWLWLRLSRTWETGTPISSATAPRSRAASSMLSTHRSVAISATLVSPSPSTRAVAVRSLSIAWIGEPKSRRPPFPVPSSGLIVRRAAPA